MYDCSLQIVNLNSKLLQEECQKIKYNTTPIRITFQLVWSEKNTITYLLIEQFVDRNKNNSFYANNNLRFRDARVSLVFEFPPIVVTKRTNFIKLVEIKDSEIVYLSEHYGLLLKSTGPRVLKTTKVRNTYCTIVRHGDALNGVDSISNKYWPTR